MALFSEPQLAVIFALITLFVGIFWEKFYVGRDSMIVNSLCVVITIGTTDVFSSNWSILGFFLIIMYLIAGWGLVKITGHNNLKQLFGSKAYGSLAMAVAIEDMNWSIWSKQFLSLFENSQIAPVTDFLENNVFLFNWLVVIVIVIILFVIIRKKKTVVRI